MIYLIKFGKCRSLVLFVIGLVIFGDMKILSTLKIWLFYTQGNKNKIISHTFLLDHSVIKNVLKNPILTVIWQNIWKEMSIKRNYWIFLPAARSDIAGQALISFIDLGPITRLLSEHFVGAFTQSGSTNLCLNLAHDL